MKKFIKRNILVILITLVLILTFLAIFFYTKSIRARDPNTAEIKSLIRKIGKHMVLPKNELPAVSTISDPEFYKNEVFFNGAQSGDKVLIYSKARRAVLFSVDKERIINIAPVRIDIDENDKQVVKYSF
jgi:hypothetical protein